MAVLAVTLLGLAGCSSDPDDQPTSTPTPPSPFSPYVALGDSYTAVSGTDAQFGDACLRSENAYPNLLAAKLGIADVRNVACGGARSENLRGTQYPSGKDRQDPQLDALSDQTKLVTVGIGLNDEDYLVRTLAPCYLLGGREQKACAPFLASPQFELDELVATIGDNVARDLEDIKEAAPNARIVFVGYPRLLPDGKACPSQVPLAARAVDRVRASGADVSRELKSVAKKADVDYLDMYAASEGHDVCSKQPWVNGQRTRVGEAFYFHPFPAYHEAVAEKLAALLTK